MNQRFEHMAMLAGRAPSPRVPDRSQLSPTLQKITDQCSMPTVTRAGGAAVVRIDGPVMNDPGWWYDCLECMTHSALARTFDALRAEASVHTVALDLQCPGWGCDGSSDTIAALTNLAKSKRVVAYVHDLAASGGAWMASLCRDVSISPMGTMGSIGTLILAYDTSEMAAKAGIVPVVIASDTDKAAGAMGVPITDTVKANLQRLVDETTTDFFAAVSKGRGISADALSGMKAGMFSARDCVAMKLADRIESPDAFFSRLGAMQPMPPDPMPVMPDDQEDPQEPQSPALSARDSHSRKEHRMDYEKLTVADLRANAGALVGEIEKAAASAEQAKANAPATYQQLKESFASDAQFIVDCQEKNLSVGEAHKAYAAKLTAANTALSARVAELESKAAEASKSRKTEGEEPLSINAKGQAPAAAQGAPGSDHPFMLKVKSTAESMKCDIARAMATVARQEPELHKQFIADATKEMKARAAARAA